MTTIRCARPVPPLVWLAPPASSGGEMYLAPAFHSLLPLLEETKKEKDAPDPLHHTTLCRLQPVREQQPCLCWRSMNCRNLRKDLLDPADELCEFIHRQGRPDGSLSCGDLQPDGTFGPEEASAQLLYPGQALYALMHSYRSSAPRPGSWIWFVRPRAIIRKVWRENQTMTSVPVFTAAYAEAYLITHEQVFLDAVNEMNDWLCSTPVWRSRIRPRLLSGAVVSWAGLNGKPARTAPTISSAEYG